MIFEHSSSWNSPLRLDRTSTAITSRCRIDEVVIDFAV